MEHMTLKDFIKGSLVQIVQGVNEAQEETQKTGATVSPHGYYTPDGRFSSYLRKGRGVAVEIIQFDIAVTVTGSSEGKAGLGIFAGGLGIGAQGKTDTGNSNVSRMRFSVPLRLPQRQIRIDEV